MRRHNPHSRIITAHGPGAFNGSCPASGLCDIFTLQKHFKNWGTGNRVGDRDDGVALAVPGDGTRPWYDFVSAARQASPATPTVLAEFLYEPGLLRGCAGSCCGGCHEGCSGWGCNATPSDVTAMRRVLWDVYMANGFGVWYNCDMAWDVLVLESPPGFRYVKILSGFWASVTNVQWMQPRNDLLVRAEGAGHISCLADVAHRECVMSLPSSARVSTPALFNLNS